MSHVIFAISLLFSLPNTRRKVPFFLTLCTLFLFAALRYDFGNDYMAYYSIHTAINNGLPSHGQNDLLYKLLNLMIPNFFWFVAFTSLFYMIGIGYLIRINLKPTEYWFSMLILLLNPYLFLVHLSSMRQTLAIVIVIFAMEALALRKGVLFSLLILLASGFHKSALVLLPLYFIINQRKIGKNAMLLILGLIVIMLGTPIFDWIINLVLHYFPQYTVYYEYGLKNSIRSTLISSFFLFLVLFNLDKLDGKEVVYGKLSLLSVSISVLSARLALLGRIGMYFAIFTIVTVPRIFSKITNKNVRLVLFVVMMAIYLLRYFSFFSNPLWNESYSSYRTIMSR